MTSRVRTARLVGRRGAAHRLRGCPDENNAAARAARCGDRGRHRAGAGRRAPFRGEPRARRIPPPARHAAVLRHQARHDVVEVCGRARVAVHRGARAVARGGAQVVRRAGAAGARQRIRHGQFKNSANKLAARPDLYGKAVVTTLGPGGERSRRWQRRPGRDIPQPAQLDESRLCERKRSRRCSRH